MAQQQLKNGFECRKIFGLGVSINNAVGFYFKIYILNFIWNEPALSRTFYII